MVEVPPRRKRRGAEGRADQVLLEQYLNQELDRHEREIGAEGSMSEAEHEVWLAKNPRRWALHMAAEKRDLGPMRELVRKTLGDEFVRYVQFPKHDKRLKKGTEEYLDSKPHLEKKTRAVWEARRAQTIMRHASLVGYEPRTYWKVAAARAGLIDVDVLRDWERQADCLPDPWSIVLPPE